MKHFNLSDLGVILTLFSATAFLLSRTLRTQLNRLRGRRWPQTTATIQRAGVGLINVPDVKGRVGFFGYAYTLEDAKYAGLFAMLCDQKDSNRLHGESIQIRYNPSCPETSFIENLRDARFEGYMATQDQNWLSQAPDPGLRTPIA